MYRSGYGSGLGFGSREMVLEEGVRERGWEGRGW